ncbi:MAG: hypothetical protein FJ098_16070, partial [Deltaproteobacteria bacterium]|nr:hypothetical protein [Deltaproteobacteria bacterium]
EPKKPEPKKPEVKKPEVKKPEPKPEPRKPMGRSPASAILAELMDLKKEEVQDLCRRHGIPVGPADTKTDLVRKLLAIQMG